MNIFVGNLPYELSEEELRQTFEAFGKVDKASIIKDKFTGKSRGFGFVEMPEKAEADAALAGLNDKDVKGRKLIVNEARSRGESHGGGNGGRDREHGHGGGGRGRRF